MKAIDTNILVRFLLEDDPAMAETATRLLTAAEAEEDPFFVSLLVTLELHWVLASCYQFTRDDILKVFEELLLMPALTFEEPNCVSEFISVGRASNLDLADILIGLRAKNAGASTTLTFDKRAARSDLFEEVA